MYVFYVYLQKGESPDIMDMIYSKMISTYREVAEYVELLNKDNYHKDRGHKFYFIRKVYKGR